MPCFSFPVLTSRLLCKPVLLALCVLTAQVQAAELGKMEVRSEVGMPFIAHIEMQLEPGELSNPEAVSVRLIDSNQKAFSSLVRTRLFFAPQSLNGFIRVTALEPVPRGTSLVFSASGSLGEHVREYRIHDPLVQFMDVKRPKAEKEVVQPVDIPPTEEELLQQAQAQARILEPAPPDGIELRLMDQTESESKLAPRVVASDLDLLARSDAALNTDPAVQANAKQALTELGGLGEQFAGLFAVKAAESVIRAALLKEIERNPSNYTLTIQADAPAPERPLARLGEPGDKEAATKLTKPPSPGFVAPLAPELEQPADVAPGPKAKPVEAKPQGGGWKWIAGGVIGFSIAFLMLGVLWFIGMRKQATSQQQAPSMAGQQAERQAPQRSLEAAELAPDLDEPKSIPASLPNLLEDDLDVEQLRAEQWNFVAPDEVADVDGPATAAPPAQESISRPATQHSPPPWVNPEPAFKNENDSRLELAMAYLEIEDFEAAMAMLNTLEGELTDAQRARLNAIRADMVQGSARS